MTPARSAWLVAALLAAGVAIRIALQLPLHRFANDADCTAIGFGAWEILAGDLRIFVSTGYRQGALACYLAAAASLFVGPGRAALALEVCAVGIVQMLVWWRALLELTGWKARGASSARLLVFIVLPSPAVLYWGIYWPEGYPEIFLAAMLVLWAGARLWRRGGRWNLFALGLAAGFAFWMSPLTLAITIPTVVWWAWQRGSEFLSASACALLAAGGLVGASPWLIFNLRYDWASLTLDWTARPATGLRAIAGNAGRLFGETLPTLLASMAPAGYATWANDFQRALAPVALALVGLVLVVLLRAAALASRVRRARQSDADPREPKAGYLAPLALAGGIVAMSSILFIFSAAGSASGNTVRYTLPVYLVWPLLFALACETAGKAARRLLAVLALAALAGFASAVPWPWTAERTRERAALGVVREIVERLETSGVEAVFGSFWEVYPVLFESGGRLAGSTLEPTLDTHRQAARLPSGPCRWALVARGMRLRHLAETVGARGEVEPFSDGLRLFVADPGASPEPAVTCGETLAQLRAAIRR